ncbi:MAG: hypothetical protein QOF97_3116 [Acidimicrobiaceae bacterium]
MSQDGLTFVIGASTRNLNFGSDKAAVMTALQSAEGAPRSVDTGSLCEDGSGRVFDTVLYDGLSVYFLNATLSGWRVSKTQFTTLDGVGPGSTLTQLRAAFAEVKVTDSSLGVEWSAGTLGGVLSGKSDDSIVGEMFAGDLCIIR